MRIKMIGILVAAGLTVGGCATNRYGYNDGYYGDEYRDARYRDNNGQAGQAAVGAAVGAAAGAGLGAIIDGVSPTQGAIVGAIAGGTIGAATHNRNRYDDRYNDPYYRGRVQERYWQRDDRGYCFYRDNRGERIYDYNIRC